MANEKKTRIYKVNLPDGNVALVDAGSARGAVNHIVGSFFKASIATQHDLVNALAQGVKIEKAGEEQSEQGELEGTSANAAD